MAIFRRTPDGKFEQYEQTDLTSMGKLEWDLEDWLIDHRQLLFPNDDVFIFGRQSHVGSGGISDLLGFDFMGNLFIIELKRGTHGRQCIAQALDYVSELADWDYPQFQALWQQYQKQRELRPVELRHAHQEFHGLREPLAEPDFNSSQYIVIVSGGPDEKAKRISGWLQSADMPMYYSTFEIYQAAGRPDDLLIDVSPVEVAIESKGQVFDKDFWLNSDEKNVPGSYEYMLKHGLACTFGPIEYGQKLQPFEKGSRVFLYCSKVGIIAEGIVTEPWSGEANAQALTVPGGVNQRNETRWPWTGSV